VRVEGVGTVGVTWEHGAEVADDAIAVEARTYQDGGWSGWTEVPYHDDHAPDPGTREARRARPGTEPLVVGDADRVQVRVAARSVPADMRLAVVDPGEATRTARQLPRIDTAELADDPAPDGPQDATADDGSLELQAAVTAPRPTIYSRAQWGANERLRDPGSLHYYEVHAGFVHHTVNTNDYTRAEVPGIIRSIYAYHTRSRGWSDIGYNFLVDRFGRIWEGRYGGVDRPVVGAHTLGYNDHSFAMSAIGNFETARPGSAMVQAYAALFAWKLGLHGIAADDTRQLVAGRYFPAINGHRDADSTACPGRYLYAKIPTIRTLASDKQKGWAGRDLQSNLFRTERPDLVFRRSSDGHAVLREIVYRDGRHRLSRPFDTGLDLSAAGQVLRAGDWNRDGRGDLIVRHSGSLWLHAGRGDGTFAPATLLASRFGQVVRLGAVGDFTGDGWPDLVGQPKGGSMRVYPGNGTGLKASYPVYSAIDASRQIPMGRWNADGASDSLFRTGDRLVLYPGNGPGGFTGRRTLDVSVAGYSWLVGIDDVDVTGHSDVVARSKADGRLWVLPGRPGQFRPRVPLLGDTSGYNLMS
jgi:hypothetical protein